MEHAEVVYQQWSKKREVVDVADVTRHSGSAHLEVRGGWVGA